MRRNSGCWFYGFPRALKAQAEVLSGDVKVVRSYSKGYRVERLAIEYMRRKYGAVCVRSAGSHGACDLLCGNGREVYAVQVKAGRKKPSVSWGSLESFAKMFNAKPLLLYKPDRKGFIEIWRPACG